MSRREPFIDAITAGRDRWGPLVWRRDSDGVEVRLHPTCGLRFYARFLIQRWHRVVPGTSGTRPTREHFFNLEVNGAWERHAGTEALFDEMAWRRLLPTPALYKDRFGLTLSRFVKLVHRPADSFGFTPGTDLGFELRWTSKHRFQLSARDVRAIRVSLDELQERAA